MYYIVQDNLQKVKEYRKDFSKKLDNLWQSGTFQKFMAELEEQDGHLFAFYNEGEKSCTQKIHMLTYRTQVKTGSTTSYQRMEATTKAPTATCTKGWASSTRRRPKDAPILSPPTTAQRASCSQSSYWSTSWTTPKASPTEYSATDNPSAAPGTVCT